MARYTGPATKKARTFGEAIFGYDRSFEKRKYPPGQHGNSRRRKQRSDYALQLMEKQKAKYTYGLLERQFRNTFEKAAHRKGVTGDLLLQMLESRLDNTVFRMGFADSRQQARQLVRHGHFTVNGRKTDIPSFQVRAGDMISVRTQSRTREYFSTATDLLQSKQAPEWLSVSPTELSGRVLALPGRDQMEIPQFNEALIVEYYSR